MATGTVKWFDHAKGFGFIQPDEGGKDVFVHRSNVLGDDVRPLADGAKVAFVPAEAEKGPEATKVAPIV